MKAVIVKEHTGDIVKSFSGDVRARTESALGFRVPGKIVERLVDIGDEVKIGQIIARLDDTDLVLSENSARAAADSAKTRLAVAKDAFNRAEALLPKGFTPQAVVDQRKLEVDAAQAALDAAEAQARQAANSSGYAVLKADKAGIVTAVQAQAGQVVAAGSPVVSVARAGEMEVAFRVPEQDVTQLAIGQDADLTLWADNGIKAKGSIREIAGQADPGSRTYAVRVALANPPAAMRLGMTVTAALRLRSGSPHIALPLPALTEVEGRKAVFVADRATSKVAPRFVETGGVAAEDVKIVAGLKPGEVVVTGGVQFLTDGMEVRLPPGALQTAAAKDAEPSR
ncbi:MULTISPECIES: efflux RND transporter periplasmic adaptor subunit [Rhodomicrobium]|uniref:efflux RND transporter periplasmic adaptor subunit n=1 Tax=Rhodomicrobium TaxID=1068 RepID=UPI001482E081|nr:MULTISPECIES: efflux RND transporter periplasmic adaptor subunit [Rhodomicrobium]